MAFNITGAISLTTSVPREVPNTPMNLQINRTSLMTARLSWIHEPRVVAPHVGFRVESKATTSTLWETVGTVDNSPTSGTDFNFEISNIADLAVDQDYRVTAIGAVVGARSNDSAASDSVTLDLDAVNVPQNVMVTAIDGDINRCMISWDYTQGFNIVSFFEIECQSITVNDASMLLDGDNWTLIGTVSAQMQAQGTTTTYSYIQNGYGNEDDFIFYRIRTVNTNGTASTFSSVSNPPFTPITPVGLTLTFTRNDVNSGVLQWPVPTGLEFIRAFIIEVSEGENTAFSTLNTIDPTASRITLGDGTEVFSYEILGLASESLEQRWQVHSVGHNNQEGGTSNIEVFTPLAPGSPVNTQATVNTGVGLVTSISLQWTRPAETNTLTNGFILEYRRTTSGNTLTFEQIGIYAGDISSAEILPPQQGAIDLRLTTLGSNGLRSIPSSVLQVVVTPGSATDDAIYNGDAAFIANAHFSVNDDDIYLTNQPTSNPQQGLLINNIQNGVFFTDADGNSFVDGSPNADLIIDWRFPVETSVVQRQRHFYLNLDALIPVNNPTRIWDVDTGNVIIEVISDPTITSRFYETATDATFMYFDETDQPNTTATRFFSQRSTGAADLPMFVSRTQVRLTMRRVFTFRVAGLSTLRITFLADNVGNPRIPIPNPGETPTAANAFCLEAFASEVTETRAVTVPITNDEGTIAITFTEVYEEPPMVVATPNGPCITWVTNVTETGCTLHVQNITAGSTATSCGVNFTVRGY